MFHNQMILQPAIGCQLFLLDTWVRVMIHWKVFMSSAPVPTDSLESGFEQCPPVAKLDDLLAYAAQPCSC